MNHEIEKEQRGATVVLRGDLTIQRAGELKAILLNHLNGGKITLDLTDSVSIDVAILQLLCSAHRTAQNRGGDVLLATPLPPLLREAAAAAGFVRHMECRLDRNHSCLWHPGEQV